MKTIEVKQLGNFDSLLKTIPTESHYDTVIKEDTVIKVCGKSIGVYVNIDKALLGGMRRVARDTKFTKTQRTWGLPTQSSVFGALPRNPLRNDRCRFSKQTNDERKNFAESFAFGEKVGELYKMYLPEEYEQNDKLIRENIDESWLPSGVPFTTCNFNVNHAIKYHRDTGNFKGVFSNVLILKEGVTGGLLVFPELKIAFEQSDGALGIFDGQKWIHGVTPIIQTKKTGYRASIVFYALEGMKKCYPYKAELQRFSQIKTKRALERAKGNPSLKAMVKK